MIRNSTTHYLNIDADEVSYRGNDGNFTILAGEREGYKAGDYLVIQTSTGDFRFKISEILYQLTAPSLWTAKALLLDIH